MRERIFSRRRLDYCYTYCELRCDFVDLSARKMYNYVVVNSCANRLPPVSLAFIGDAVYTLFMREKIVTATDGVVGTLHAAVTKLVNAGRQAYVFDRLAESKAFSAEEDDIARRAKNAHLHSRAKAASVEDYHKATALEAVIGYVHLSGDAQREKEILELCFEIAHSRA